MQLKIVLSSESAAATPGSRVPKVAADSRDREHFRRKMDLNERLGREDDIADIEKTQEELDKKVSSRMSKTVMSNFKFGTKGKERSPEVQPDKGEKKSKKKSDEEFDEDTESEDTGDEEAGDEELDDEEDVEE